jgi:hypothetical protein
MSILCDGVPGSSGRFRGICLCPQNSVSRKQRLWFEETRFEYRSVGSLGSVLMKIDSATTIGGVPLIKVRDLLRYMGAGTMGGERTLTHEGIARRVGRDIADELVGEGLLQVCRKDRDGGPWYEITDAAPRLANVKMLKCINRSKADL